MTLTEKEKVENCKSFKELREVMERGLFCAQPGVDGSVNDIIYQKITSRKIESLAGLLDLHVFASEKFSRLFFELGWLPNLETAIGNNDTFQLIESLAFQLYDCKLSLRDAILYCYFGEEAVNRAFGRDGYEDSYGPIPSMDELKQQLEDLSGKKMPFEIAELTCFSQRPNIFENVDEYFCSYNGGNLAYFTAAAYKKHNPHSTIPEGARALERTHELQKASSALGYGEIFYIPPSTE